MAWAHGSLALATWTSIAAGLGLTLLVPSAARAEVLLVRPGDAALLDVLLAEPAVLVLDSPDPRQRGELGELWVRTGVFDPLAGWVISLCRSRGWPALSGDPARLRRFDATVEIDLL